MAEILPFADPRVLKLDGQLERAVYDALKPAWSAGRPVLASGGARAESHALAERTELVLLGARIADASALTELHRPTPASVARALLERDLGA